MWLPCLLWVTLICYLQTASSIDCNQAPTEAMRIICQQLQRWDEGARQVPSPSSVKPPSIGGEVQMAAEFAPIASNMYQCMDIACLCAFFRGTGGSSCVVQGHTLGKALRKEYRQLSDDERNRVHAAFHSIKASGEYSRLATIHAQFASSGGAHSGPAFLPWHREYMKRAEIALRQVDPELALPYWDSTLDENMPDSKDSIMWTNEFMGETKGGEVVGGPFREWLTLEARSQDESTRSDCFAVLRDALPRYRRRRGGCYVKEPGVTFGVYMDWMIISYNDNLEVCVGGLRSGRFFSLMGRPRIRRAVGAKGKLFSENEIRSVLSQNDIGQVLAFTAPKQGCPFQPNFNVLEYTHGNPHIYVGGEMFEQLTSANDPVFFMHHSFVDYIWEMYRQNVQSRSERERAWPPDNIQCSSEHHFSNAFMRPFPPMRNTDGLSNMYTDNMYSYSPRPSCSMGSNCGSKFLYCDQSHGQPRCAAKIKPGGNCSGLHSGEDACYGGHCVGDRCTAESSQSTPPPPMKPLKPVVEVQQTCFNEHECCSYWSGIGECPRNPVYMSQWCKASCHVCTPKYDMNIECLDRHVSCATWTRDSECLKNPLWMSENCRSACNKCGLARVEVCSRGMKSQASRCNSPMCYNENQCCSFWAFEGECRTNPGFMLCQCRVSCQQCQPNYLYGECADYHSDCGKWARTGECSKNKWMPENCRRSCGSCVTM